MRRQLLISVAAMAVAAIAGCATSPTGGDGTMLDGSLVSLKDGVVMPFQIERSRGTGALRATNPQTGEVFEGQYTGRFTGGGFATGSVFTPGVGYSTVHLSRPPTGAEARGYLRGSKGTVISVALDIVPAILRPHGYGEGKDNKGNNYQVQF